MKLTARALSLLPRTYTGTTFQGGGASWSVPNVDGTPLTMRLIASYAAQNPGLEFGNYCSGWNDKDGRAAYLSESRAITRDLARVRNALRDAYFAGATDADVLEASKHAFSGRLTLCRERQHTCGCGHTWAAEVKTCTPTANLSGEATQWCPKCNARPTMSEPIRYHIEYCTGQYWPTEYRKACASVLEYAARIAARRAEEKREPEAA